MLSPLAARGVLTPLADARPASGGPALEAVGWTQIVKCVVDSPNHLRKSTASAWDGGAVSSRAIQSGAGYLEFTFDSSGGIEMFVGLSKGNTDASLADIDFACYISGNQLNIWENGVAKKALAYNGIVPGDLLRVAVDASGVVTYYAKGGLVYTSLKAAAYPLLVDTCLYTQGVRCKSAQIYGLLDASGY